MTVEYAEENNNIILITKYDIINKVMSSDNTSIYIISFVLIGLLGFSLLISNDKDNYRLGDPEYLLPNSKYMQMTHLPYCTPPTGITTPQSLGFEDCTTLKKRYPRHNFSLGKVPVSISKGHGVVVPGNYGIRIYETGNSMNPNTHNTWGVITANDIDF